MKKYAFFFWPRKQFQDQGRAVFPHQSHHCSWWAASEIPRFELDWLCWLYKSTMIVSVRALASAKSSEDGFWDFLFFFFPVVTCINNSRNANRVKVEKGVYFIAQHLSTWRVCLWDDNFVWTPQYPWTSQPYFQYWSSSTVWWEKSSLSGEMICGHALRIRVWLVIFHTEIIFANCWTSVEYIFPLEFHSTSLLKSLLLYSQSCLQSSNSTYKFFQPSSSFIPKPYSYLT